MAVPEPNRANNQEKSINHKFCGKDEEKKMFLLNFHSFSFGKNSTIYTFVLWHHRNRRPCIEGENRIGMRVIKNHIDFYLICPSWCVYKTTQIMCTYSAWEKKNGKTETIQAERRIDDDDDDDEKEKDKKEDNNKPSLNCPHTLKTNGDICSSLAKYLFVHSIVRCLAWVWWNYTIATLLQTSLKFSQMCCGHRHGLMTSVSQTIFTTDIPAISKRNK